VDDRLSEEGLREGFVAAAVAWEKGLDETSAALAMLTTTVSGWQFTVPGGNGK
jgi:hypothetical protein